MFTSLSPIGCSAYASAIRRSDRRAQGDRPTLRSIRPTRAVLLALARTIASSAAVGIPQGARVRCAPGIGRTRTAVLVRRLPRPDDNRRAEPFGGSQSATCPSFRRKYSRICACVSAADHISSAARSRCSPACSIRSSASARRDFRAGRGHDLPGISGVQDHGQHLRVGLGAWVAGHPMQRPARLSDGFGFLSPALSRGSSRPPTPSGLWEEAGAPAQS